jgi:cytochrome oxidase Cu insertion factor (SCO1/SenC/PrrC family)
MQNPSLLPSRPRLIVALGILALALLGGIMALTLKQPNLGTGTGTALVGGPFTMVNQRGSVVTEKTYAGKYMLVFFGFTSCPDVCPTTLQVITEALDQLGDRAHLVVPILVTVDPDRDRPDVMAAYIRNFSSRLEGLTGSSAQVAAMAKAYRVFYTRVENAKSPADYTMDHSSTLYLMGPDGKFLKHFSYTTDVGKLAADLSAAL